MGKYQSLVVVSLILSTLVGPGELFGGSGELGEAVPDH